MIHYYRATDGALTVFRASKREYRSASWRTSRSASGIPFPGGPISFSAKAPTGPGQYYAQEIQEDEYNALMARKNERVKAAGYDLRAYTSPQDSWVRNGG